MAIIATLKPLETSPGAVNTHSIASIPLNKLTEWDGNVRKTRPDEGLDELIANIAAEGLLQSLVVRKSPRGKFAVVAGRRRFRALSALAEAGTIASDSPIPCRVVSSSADSTEISLAENVVRAPMHPADQYEAFRALIDKGQTVADIAARFGVAEEAVQKRLKLARIAPPVFAAYREGRLSLAQIQAFAISEDHTAQERVFESLPEDGGDPRAIRRALTENEVPATDKRVRFVSLSAYEEAGGAVRRDLFTEGDEGAFITDVALLGELVREKLEGEAATLKAAGWKWIEAHPEFGYEERSHFRRIRPQALPMSAEAQAEHKRLAEEYQTLFESHDEHDEESSERLDAIEERITELEQTGEAYTPDAMAAAGAVVTIGHGGALEIIHGLVRPEDEPDRAAESEPRERPLYSASLIESLTSMRSAALSASLLEQPAIALAAVTHALAASVFGRYGEASCLQLQVGCNALRDTCLGVDSLDAAGAKWEAILPQASGKLWAWCLGQPGETLLSLLAYCAARSLDGVQRKADRPGSPRLSHAQALGEALRFDFREWFTPTAENYFSRVSRHQVAAAIAEAKAVPAKRSWDKLKKSELALLAEREIAGSGWLPEPVRV